MLQRLLYLFPWFGTHVRVIVPTKTKGMVRAVPIESAENLKENDQVILVKYFRFLGKHYPLKTIKITI